MFIHGGIFLSMTLIPGDVTQDPETHSVCKETDKYPATSGIPGMTSMLPGPAIFLRLL